MLMKNFTLRTLFLVTLVFVGFTSNAQVWNFSSATLSVLGSTTATKTVEGLTIYAAATAAVDVDANAKELDGLNFTHRIKLGGTGAWDAEGKPVSRVLAIPVTGNSKITIMGMSSSSSADRELIIAAGKKETEIGRFPALGASISKGEYNYTGAATTIYLFSPSSGVNIYYIKVAPLTTGLIDKSAPDFGVYPNPANGKVFVSVANSTEVGIYSISGKLMKQQLVSPSNSQINISDLSAGVYFVKAMNDKGFVKKLVIN